MLSLICKQQICVCMWEHVCMCLCVCVCVHVDRNSKNKKKNHEKRQGDHKRALIEVVGGTHSA